MGRIIGIYAILGPVVGALLYIGLSALAGAMGIRSNVFIDSALSVRAAEREPRRLAGRSLRALQPDAGDTDRLADGAADRGDGLLPLVAELPLGRPHQRDWRLRRDRCGEGGLPRPADHPEPFAGRGAHRLHRVRGHVPCWRVAAR